MPRYAPLAIPDGFGIVEFGQKDRFQAVRPDPDTPQRFLALAPARTTRYQAYVDILRYQSREAAENQQSR